MSGAANNNEGRQHQHRTSSTSGGPPPHQRTNESILELQKMMEAHVRVQCLGGRELRGILRGFDDLMNLVLDDSEEYIRDPETQTATDKTRKLGGLVVIRGTQVSLVSPQDGVEEIANPFVAAADDDDIPEDDEAS